MKLAIVSSHRGFSNRRSATAWASTLAVIIATSLNAHAWGYEGHRFIAEIAEQFLQPETTRQVRELLAIENVTTLAEVSTWADQIRVQHPETRPWHYVNIPIHPREGKPMGCDAARDCLNGACVVAKIEQFERELADKETSGRQRLEALKYLVHFIGDVHQPLHASDNNDRGGNDVLVVFNGRQTNLHAVWDSGVIEGVVKGDERGYAMQLARDISQTELSQWSQGNAISWANEAHGIAASAVYGELRHSGTLPDSYQAQAIRIVDQQLERAGVRLALVLNACLK